MPRVSVIIPTFDRADSLRLVLRTLARQTLDRAEFEVIVVDDGSTDCTADVIALNDLDGVRCARQSNQGEIAARNHGVSLARGRLLTFLDDDIYVAPHYLKAMTAAHADTAKRVVIGNVRPVYCPPGADPLETLSALVRKDTFFRPERVSAIEVCSHSMLVSRDGYEEIGGMQPLGDGGRNAWGGIDFGYRAHSAGYEVYRAPSAVGVHNDGALRSYRAKALRWERVCALAPLLLQRYPALQGRIPMLRDKEQIDWRSDGLRLIGRKLIKRILALPIATELIDLAVATAPAGWRPQLETWGLEPHMVRGFRRGLCQYGSARQEVRSQAPERGV